MKRPFKSKLLAIALASTLGAPVATLAADSTAERAAERTGEATERAAERTGQALERTAEQARRATDRATDPAAKSIDAVTDKAERSVGAKKVHFPDMRASELIGKEVVSPTNENLGEIRDLVMDMQNQSVQYAILSFGGFLGLGDKLFAYPVSQFRPAQDDDKLLLNVSKERLKQAPGFEHSNYPDFDKSDYRASVDRFFGKPKVAQKSAKAGRLQRASELIGENIEDRAGRNVGEIEDFVVNMSNGRVKYAVLDVDKSWTPDEKLRAVPLRTLSASKDGDKVVINMDKQRLERAYSFDENNWPDVADAKVGSAIERSTNGRRTGSQDRMREG